MMSQIMRLPKLEKWQNLMIGHNWTENEEVLINRSEIMTEPTRITYPFFSILAFPSLQWQQTYHLNQQLAICSNDP